MAVGFVGFTNILKFHHFLILFLLLPQTHALAAANASCRWNPFGPLLPRGGSTCPPPIDERSSSERKHQSLWSHSISCLRPNSGLGPVYCLFTSVSFGENHGFSIITTPEIAAGIVGEGELGDSHSPWDLEKLSLVPGAVSNSEGPAYEVQETNGRGKGAFAKRLIRRAEVFMLDYPALLVSRQFATAVSGSLKRQMMSRGVEQLPEDTMRKYWDLAMSTGGDRVNNVFTTNSCSVSLGDNAPHMAVFPEVSVSSPIIY
jgi:hypothetical protein